MLDTADRSGHFTELETYGAGHLDLETALSPIGGLTAGQSARVLQTHYAGNTLVFFSSGALQKHRDDNDRRSYMMNMTTTVRVVDQLGLFGTTIKVDGVSIAKDESDRDRDVQIDTEGQEMCAVETAGKLEKCINIWMNSEEIDAWGCAIAIRNAYSHRGGDIPISAIDQAIEGIEAEERALKQGVIPDSAIYEAREKIVRGETPQRKPNTEKGTTPMDEETFAQAKLMFESHMIQRIVRERHAAGIHRETDKVFADVDKDGRVTLHEVAGGRIRPSQIGNGFLGTTHPFRKSVARSARNNNDYGQRITGKRQG